MKYKHIRDHRRRFPRAAAWRSHVGVVALAAVPAVAARRRPVRRGRGSGSPPSLGFSAYRPTRLQKLLILPIIGKLLASRITADRFRSALDALRGSGLTDAEFDEL